MNSIIFAWKILRSATDLGLACRIAAVPFLLSFAASAFAYDAADMKTCKEGSAADAIRACDSILKSETGYPRVTALTGRAWARYSLREYDAALLDLNEAIAAYPNSDRYAMRATIHSAQKNYDRAIDDLTASVKLERNPVRFVQRGQAYSAKGEVDLAIADFTVAIGLDNDANYFTARGAEYLRKRDYDRAIADFEEALKLRPKLSTPLFGRGMAKIFKGDQGGKADIAQVKVRSTAELYFAARGLKIDKVAEAHGSAFCSQIKRIASQAQDGFRKLRAGKDRGFEEVARLDPNLHVKQWLTTEAIPGAETCTTSISDNPNLLFRLYPQYTCTWYYYGQSEELAEDAARLSRALTACYGMAEQKPDENGYYQFSAGDAVFSVQPYRLPSYARITIDVAKALTSQQEQSCVRAKMEKRSNSRDMKVCLDSFRPD